MAIPNQTYKNLSEAMIAKLEKKQYKCQYVEIPRNIIEQLALKEEGGPRADSAPETPASEQNVIVLQNLFKPLLEARPTLIVALGDTATCATAQIFPQIPVVFCMVPNGFDLLARVQSELKTSNVAGLTSDIVPADQIAWIAKIHPQGRRIGLLCSERTRQTAVSLKSAAQARGITISTIEASKDRFPEAMEALSQDAPDSVLMIADSQIYNAANVR
ncbi:MAG: hypothetical protein GXY44_08665, partial [Phycisphaerales bacterium]|nr:hypothetical protein [Phycisphaerales bacterium]